jgi:hypothetical protein
VIGCIGIVRALIDAQEAERELIELKRETLTPEQFKEWSRDRVEAARHREIVRAIRESRPRGFGWFY